MRHSLLMTAVTTVALPGLVAVAAAVGHSRGAAPVGAAAASGSFTDSSPPSVPVSSSAAVRNGVAEVQLAAGEPVIVFTRRTPGLQAAGTRLLNQAAAAAGATSYQGTEQISESGVTGTITMTSRVWHQGGGQTEVSTSSAVSPAATSSVSSGSPEGVFGVTRSLMALLPANYVAEDRGSGSVAGRSAAVVELYRYDGSLAARYWLDKRTSLPLRRELFDPSGKLISEDEFVSVSVGSDAGSPAAAQPQQPAWVTAASAARYRASLAAQGWQVPASLPGGLPLQTAMWAQTADGRVVDLEYTDGLYVVSLFVERGALVESLPGWQPVTVAGQQAFISGHTVTWAGPGLVYTMIADAPAQTVTQVVRALPGSAPEGLLNRLGRGFERLARVFIPFG
jgi:sigma-E factor negative regulatory protein RseB